MSFANRSTYINIIAKSIHASYNYGFGCHNDKYVVLLKKLLARNVCNRIESREHNLSYAHSEKTVVLFDKEVWLLKCLHNFSNITTGNYSFSKLE